MLFCNYVFKLTLSLCHFQNWITTDVDRFLLNTSNTQELKLPSQLQRLTGYCCIKRASIYCENHTEHINTVCVCVRVRVYGEIAVFKC